ncbi:MAG: MoaD/ThiS family protein [Pseudomonadales bacterium]|nr:MoaD/ThiS family protein [Pseudomonadales bacterium]
MATVIFSTELQEFTGEGKTNVDARVYRDLVTELVARYDLLKKGQLADMAVAIDGVIIVDPLLEEILPDSEVHFLHFVAGG